MSTLKVTNIESPDGGGVSAKIADVGGGQLSNRNLIINGAMRVAQRGTSSTTTGYQTCDRWKVAWGQGAVTQTQESLTTGSPYDDGFRYFVRAQNTTASTAANSYRELIQNLEGQDIANSGWNYKSSTSYITLSYWVRSSVAQDYEALVQTRDGTNRAYSFPFTLAANTWTKITETIPGSATNQIDNDFGLGLSVHIIPYYGTDYTSSSNADRTWRDRTASDDYTPVMTSTWANTTNATFDLTGVQLEVGSAATTFEHRTFGDEIAKCKRYFQKSYSYATAVGTNTTDGRYYFLLGVDTAARNKGGSVYLGQEMRVAPTTNFYNDAGTQGVIQIPASSVTPLLLKTHVIAIYVANTASSEIAGAWTAEAEL